MGFFDSIKSLFSGSSYPREAGYWIYVQCDRCGEAIKTRLDLSNALTPHDEGGYVTHKTLVGRQLCFQRIEVVLYFDNNRRLINQEIGQGKFITAEAYESLQRSPEDQ